MRRTFIDSEENNHGIRRVNVAMGYVPVYGLPGCGERLLEQ